MSMLLCWLRMSHDKHCLVWVLLIRMQHVLQQASKYKILVCCSKEAQ